MWGLLKSTISPFSNDVFVPQRSNLAYIRPKLLHSDHLSENLEMPGIFVSCLGKILSANTVYWIIVPYVLFRTYVWGKIREF